jgi:DNA repair protein RecO (recombination protein O)
VSEKALALVVRTTDWSETSRIATLWTREFGKVRVLAKGGRRLKSNFEIALDLLAVCRIVVIRKSSGGLDLLTEAQVVEQFPRLRTDLPALYAGYYVAELLSDWTQDYDPHPALFDAAVAALRDFGGLGSRLGLRLAKFELAMLHELGYRPVLAACADCGKPVGDDGLRLAFSPALGGMLCLDCQPRHRQRLVLGTAAWRLLRMLDAPGSEEPEAGAAAVAEVRSLLGQFVTYLMGRPPRMLPYLASLK